MVLYHLRKHGGSATTDELAEAIAAMENDVPPEELTSEQRKRVYVSLYQSHLLKLDELNIIDYDVEEGTVQLTSQANAMDPYLTPKPESSYPWKRHYIALLVIASTVLVFSLIEMPVFGSFQLEWLAGILLVAYVATAFVQYWYYRKHQTKIPMELSQHDK